MRAALPDNESERLAALHAYEVLETAPEPPFDRLTRAASRVFGTPIALVTLVDEHRQFFKSAHGTEIRETPRHVAFCEHTILSDEILVVPDTTLDERFSDNPLVTGPPGLRYYVGAPLKTRKGLRLGSLCVLDTVARPRPSQCQLDVLEDLAAEVVEQLDFHCARRKLKAFEAMLQNREAELTKNQERIQQSENRTALALEAGRFGIWEWNAVTREATWSAPAERLFGLTAGTYEPSFEHWLSCIHPEDRSRIAQEIVTQSRFAASFLLNYKICRPGGEIRWISATGSFDRSQTGQLLGAMALCSDVTDRELAHRELQCSEELFRGLSISCPAGIFRADLNGHVTYANPTAASIWRMPEKELYGTGWLARVHPDDREDLVAKWVKANGEGQNHGHEYRLLFEDGSVSWIYGRSAVVCDGEGQPIGTVGTVDDVTDRKRVQRELLEAKEAAEAANRAKDLFLANVSHELRTPLNGVLGITDVLLETPLSSDQRGLAEVVRDSGQTLLAVVNDVLDLSRMGAGKLRLEIAPFNLRRTVSKAAALLQLQASAKGIALTVDYPASIPDTFLGDAERIQQVLVNYLTNAVKFTDAGNVTVQIEAESETNRTLDLLLAVHDSGPGISEQAQRFLFQPFTQVDGSSTRRHGGVGLGLAISRQIAELMGGKVGIISSAGCGSTFWLRLNLPLGPQEQIAGKEKTLKAGEKPLGPPSRGRILLAEDNAVNQKVAVHLLRKLGWSADVVPDGSTACELAQRNKYALILMDCQMPSMDGYTATSMIRSYEGSRPAGRTPIIAVTAHAMAGDRERCLHAGMDDYLAKPLQLSHLRNMLDRWAQP